MNVYARLTPSTLPDRFIRPIVIKGNEDPSHPYGQWSAVFEREGDLYTVEFLMSGCAPSDKLVPGVEFTVYNGRTDIAQGTVEELPEEPEFNFYSAAIDIVSRASMGFAEDLKADIAALDRLIGTGYYDDGDEVLIPVRDYLKKKLGP